MFILRIVFACCALVTLASAAAAAADEENPGRLPTLFNSQDLTGEQSAQTARCVSGGEWQ